MHPPGGFLFLSDTQASMIGLWLVVSYLRLSGQFQACLFFFLRKDFERTKKRHKQKLTNKNKQTKKNKVDTFLHAQKLLRE